MFGFARADRVFIAVINGMKDYVIKEGEKFELPVVKGKL